jgi:autotransporter adhesin
LNSATHKVINQMSGGIASATALTMIPQVEPGKTFSIGAGGAGYGNTGAFAVGASMRFSDQLVAKAGIGISPTGNGTQVAGGAGIAYSW